jgi:hypothetical protein
LKVALRDQEADLAVSNPLYLAAAHFPWHVDLTIDAALPRNDTAAAVSLRRTVPLTLITGANEVIE